MARLLRVVHRTEYRYGSPVRFNPHRLMLRPRDGHDLWVDEAYLTISPPATVDWHFDQFGNSIATAAFSDPAARLVIESELHLRRYGSEQALRRMAERGSPYPCSYDADEAIDLYPFLGLHNRDEELAIRDWLHAVMQNPPANAFAYLERLSAAIHDSLVYSRREAMGTQTAAETIRSGTGTCRDYAFLFMEAARLSGFATRFVTGYLASAGSDDRVRGTGATHAWADAFIPGKGWIEFDPTNRLVAGRSLIRVGTTRTPQQASPISGSYAGPGSAFEGLTVEVAIGPVD